MMAYTLGENITYIAVLLAVVLLCACAYGYVRAVLADDPCMECGEVHDYGRVHHCRRGR